MKEPRAAVHWPSRDVYLPAAFEAEFLHPAHGLGLAILEFDTIGHRDEESGPPVSCFQVTLVPPRAAELPLAAWHRAVPMATLARYALAAAARENRSEIERGPAAAYARTTDASALQESFDRLMRRPAGRPPLRTTIDLAHVAEVARNGRPHYVKAVMNAYSHRYLSRSSARRWIKAAKDAGHETM